MKKTRQNKNPEFRSDFIGTELALSHALTHQIPRRATTP
jgi:hypothetical protein